MFKLIDFHKFDLIPIWPVSQDSKMVRALFLPQKMNILEHFLQHASTCKFLKLKLTVNTKFELETTIFDLQ